MGRASNRKWRKRAVRYLKAKLFGKKKLVAKYKLLFGDEPKFQRAEHK